MENIPKYESFIVLLVYFTALWYILMPFDIFYGHWVHLMAIYGNMGSFGKIFRMLSQEKYIW
jgi:hypothetical protein